MPSKNSHKSKQTKNNDETSSQGEVNNKLDTVRWVFVIIFAIVLFANGLHFSSIFIATSILVMLPIEVFKKLLERVEISSVAAIVISFSLLTIGVLLSPIIEKEESTPANDGYQSQTSDSINGTITSDSTDESENKTDNSTIGSMPSNDNDNTDNDNNNNNNNNNDGNDSDNDSTTDTSSDKNNKDDEENDSSNGNAGESPVMPDENAEGQYSVSFDAQLIENKSVGSDWEFGIKFNDTIIESESVINFDGEGKITLTVYATEYDDKTSDYGSESVEIPPLAVGMEETLTVTVVVFENNKSTSTKTATWEFEITVKRLS